MLTELRRVMFSKVGCVHASFHFISYPHVILFLFLFSKKGAVGDCWFLAVLAAAADVAGLVPSVAVSINEQAKV